MTLYIISYDLSKPNRDYDGLYDTLKSFSSWWHYLESTWMISTTDTSDEVFEKLKPHIDEDDNLLIIEAGKKRSGWLPKKAWEWIKNHS